jgi:SAM-dependent methyltransferase
VTDTKQTIPGPAISVTHEHLLSIINTEACRRPEQTTLKILDAGCGRGKFLTYILRNLPLLQPQILLELYGFDVSDSGMQLPNFSNAAIGDLTCAEPSVDWSTRISVISSTERWPYPNDFFDVIVSNQVIEHVDDHLQFFGEVARTLKEGGYSAHLFPLAHCIWEGHIHLPFLHWFRDHDMRVSYVRLMTRLGLLKPYDRLNQETGSLDQFSEREVDVMRDFTNYLTQRQFYELGKKLKLRTSFRYTRGFFSRKLRSVTGMKPTFCYRRKRASILDFFSIIMLRYLSSITLFLEKRRGTDRPPVPSLEAEIG